MSEWFKRSCRWLLAFPAMLLACSVPLPAQQIDQGPSIDVEEYDVSVELRPSQQELQAAATLKFSSSLDRLGRIFRPSYVTLSLEDVQGLSTRNHVRGVVSRMLELAGGIFVAVDVGQILWAEVTPAAVRDLGLQTGSKVTCLIKTRSLEVVG